MDVLSEEGVTSSFPSSSTTPQWKYDVFLSFRGEDTRKNFTDHLYDALKCKEINTFRDDEGLEKGKPISELLEVIEESRFAVIVFSKNYADSKWCLDELAKIVECMTKTGMKVFPIFYHVDPSDVRNQTGTFAKSFAKQKICSMEKEETWRAALKKVSSLNGWPLQGDRHETEFIRQIVNNIFRQLHDKTKGDPFPTTKLAGKEFQINLDKICESLVDVSSIGIHGMGGVGKTTLVTHIRNRLLAENSFHVCKVTVSQDCSIKELQTKISKTINLDLSNEDDVTERAAKLYQALRRRKKFVIILDDVWDYFSLEEVGIHVEVNCKLILTTRFFNVCRMMKCSINFKVVPLNEEEAWKLFMEKFEHGIELPPEVSNIARSIANECAGLPLGIITVAGSMSGMKDIDDIRGWRNALEELNNSEFGLDGMEANVFRALKFSYSRLKNPKLQECFLYCSLYPEDFVIERRVLIEHLIDEGIIERKQSRQAKFDKGHSMLNELENAYLLEGVEDYMKNKCVKMHDLLRDMAIHIARGSHNRFMVEAGKGLKDLPDEEEWKDDLLKVSLMRNKFSEIPSNASPRCPKLLTLMLNGNRYLRRIGNSFFAHMSGLKVLNLSDTEIKDLPDSISNLENLTALLLQECSGLRHVPSLAKLTALRRLDLHLAGLEEIPQGLEMLVNLRFLDLNCPDLEIFPTGILPKLSHLQYLVFYSNSKTLKVKEEEVASLKKLEIFRGQLYDIHDFNRHVISLEEERRPNDYLLQVGVVNDSHEYLEDLIPQIEEKTVVLSKCSISKSREGGEDSLVLPKDLQILALYEIGDLRSLCDIPSFNNLAKLKELCVDRCKGVDHIFRSFCSLPLQSIECLRLSYLVNLRVLVREERVASSLVPPDTFFRLKEFKMYYCKNIKKLFTPELLLHLQNLEYIAVGCCDELVEIIGALSNEVEEEDERKKEEGMGTTIVSLPKLWVLSLDYLPKLKTICASSKVIVCDSIQEIEILNCPNLKRLPLSLALHNGQLCAPPSLEKIKATKECWESLEWDHPNSKTVLQPFHCFCFGYECNGDCSDEKSDCYSSAGED